MSDVAHDLCFTVSCDITVFVISQIWGKNQSTSCPGNDVSVQKWQV